MIEPETLEIDAGLEVAWQVLVCGLVNNLTNSHQRKPNKRGLSVFGDQIGLVNLST
jgi:hypothetical protein